MTSITSIALSRALEGQIVHKAFTSQSPEMTGRICLEMNKGILEIQWISRIVVKAQFLSTEVQR